jgi:hypothetical protein
VLVFAVDGSREADDAVRFGLDNVARANDTCAFACAYKRAPRGARAMDPSGLTALEGTVDQVRTGSARGREYTGSHTTPFARWTPILKDFCRRISPPTPRFQSPPSAPFNSASDAFQLHPDCQRRVSQDVLDDVVFR